MTQPDEMPEETDNSVRPEDGPQEDISQNPEEMVGE